MLIDTTHCTACRGCQVGCKEWHGLPSNKTIQWGSHQNPPDLNPWNLKLARFNEHEPPDGAVIWNFFSGRWRRKHLHCGLCGTDWHFVRGICPGCGAQGEEAMQILGEEERRHERIDWCKKCQTYLPLIDLRELADRPDMDAMALALMHLDIAAAEKDLMPLKPSFWNMF